MAGPYVSSRRFREQRWLLDNVIRLVGVDWDQGRSRYMALACPPDAEVDFGRVRERVRKFADIHREFAAAGRRREASADEARADGRAIAEREHAFVSSILWGCAQWPLFGNSELNLAYGDRKVACYKRFIALSPHPVRRVEIPFGNTTLPAYLHLPNAGQGPFPCVVQVGGMDSFKEHLVAIYGDRFLERGVARLTFDGPGQGESLTRGLWVTATNFIEAGRAVVEWLGREPSIDAGRIAVSGVSFGSFWATQIAGAVKGLVACAVMMVVHEPAARTAFESASPTFKSRFMYMAGYDDEAAFDAFAATLDPTASGPGIACPFLVIAGEDDDLSPIEHTWALLKGATGPRELVLYQGERHGIGSGPAAGMGPNRDEILADWLTARLAGQPMEDRLRYVTTAGTVVNGPLDFVHPAAAVVAGRGPR
ncbi:MAG: alpha/beta hydrolase family protein [Candidatus Limnocylindrales bacterium]